MGETNGAGILAYIRSSTGDSGKLLLVYRDNPCTTEIQIWAWVGYLPPQLPLILFSRCEPAVKLRSKAANGSVTFPHSFPFCTISSHGIEPANTVAVLWVIFSKG